MSQDNSTFSKQEDQAANQLLAVSAYLGVDISNPPTIADLQETQAKFEYALFEAGSDYAFAEKLATPKDGSRPSNADIGEAFSAIDKIKTSINILGDKLTQQPVAPVAAAPTPAATVNNAKSGTIERPLSTNQIQEIKEEFATLGKYLGVTLNPEILSANATYPLVDVENVANAFKAGIEYARNNSPQPPLMSETPKETLVQKILQDNNISNLQEINNVRLAVRDAESNINNLYSIGMKHDKSLNMQNTTPTAAATAQATQPTAATTTTTVMRYIGDPDPRVKNLEKALAKIVPKLNELDTSSGLDISSLSKTPLPGAADGYVDDKLLPSYKGAMQHLNYLAYVSENPRTIYTAMDDGSLDAIKKAQSNEFDSDNAEAIKAILIKPVQEDIDEKTKKWNALKSSGTVNKAESFSLYKEIEDLKTLKRDTIPQVMKDIASLHNDKTLETLDVMQKVVIEQPAVITQPNVTSAPNPTTVNPQPKTSSPTTESKPVDAESNTNDKPPTAAEIAAMNKDMAETTAENAQVRLNDSIDSVEQILFLLGEKINDIDTMGLSESIVTPLTSDDLSDGILGENSQDFLAKAIVLFKTLANEGKPEDQKDNNPNGVYTKEFGVQFKYEILTNPAMKQLREALKVPLMSKADQAIYFRTPTSDEDRQKLESDRAKIDKALGLGAPLKENGEKDGDYSYTLNGFIASLDNIKAAGNILDEKKAQQTTKMNIMLDGMHMAMSKWAPGFSDILKDLFTGTEFGKMISGVLSLMGINVGRLWGDKDDEAGLERAKPAIEKGFEFFYKGAEKELGSEATFEKTIDKMKADMLDKFNGSGDGFFGPAKKMAFDKAMGAIFKGQDEDVVEKILTEALDKAKAAGPEGAKAAFSSYIVEAGKLFKDGQKITIEQLNEKVAAGVAASKEMKEHIPADIAAKAEADAAAIVAAAGVTNTAKAAPTDPNGQITFDFTDDTKSYNQGPMRYSHGRVDDIQAALADLDLHVTEDEMKNSDGVFTDTATRKTSMALEEALLLAQIHHLNEEDGGVTKAEFDGLEHKLTTDNIHVLLPQLKTYMVANGVDTAKIEAMSAALTELAEDFKSTDKYDKLAGDSVKYSVLDQSILDTQVKLDINFALTPDVVIAQNNDIIDVAVGETFEYGDEVNDPNSLREQYLNYKYNGETNRQNVEKECDIPVFSKNNPLYPNAPENDSVYAIVRVKNDGDGDTDPYNDTYKVLEIKNYLGENGGTIYDKNITAELLELYNFKFKSQKGIEDVINEVLCLDRPGLTVEMAKEEAPKTLSKAFNECSTDCSGDNPRAFVELCRLTGAQGKYLKDNFNVDLEAIFEKHSGIEKGTSVQSSRTMIMDLKAFGIEGAGLPRTAVAVKFGDTLNISIIYDNDNIMSMDDHRDQGRVVGLGQKVNSPLSDKIRLDDVLAFYKREPGLKEIQSGNIMDGFVGMIAITPDGNGGSISQRNALSTVYGAVSTKETTEYANSYGHRLVASASNWKALDYGKTSGDKSDPTGRIRSGGNTPSEVEPVPHRNKTRFAKAFDAIKSWGDDPIKTNMNDMTDASNDSDYNDPFADIRHVSTEPAITQNTGVGAR